MIVRTGALSAFGQAFQLVDRGGTIMCFATTLPDVEATVPVNDFWRKGIKLLPSYANWTRKRLSADLEKLYSLRNTQSSS